MGKTYPCDSRPPSTPANLAAVRARIDAAAREAKRDPASVASDRRHQDVRRRGHRARARRRPPPVRREPRAGGQGQMAGAARALSRHRAAPDRPAADQQGRARPWSCSTRSTPSTGPRSPRPSPPRWRGRASACSCFVQVNTGEEPQKAGVLPREADAFVRLCREELKLDDRRPDVHPARRRGARRRTSPSWPSSPRATACASSAWA